jgi:hypothetical protein
VIRGESSDIPKLSHSSIDQILMMFQLMIKSTKEMMELSREEIEGEYLEYLKNIKAAG